jgi:acetyl-CoA acetyltransferase
MTLEIDMCAVSWASVGVDPTIMGYGPVPAIKKALHIAGRSSYASDTLTHAHCHGRAHDCGHGQNTPMLWYIP